MSTSKHLVLSFLRTTLPLNAALIGTSGCFIGTRWKLKLEQHRLFSILQPQSTNRPTGGTSNANEVSGRWCAVWSMQFGGIRRKSRATKCCWVPLYTTKKGLFLHSRIYWSHLLLQKTQFSCMGTFPLTCEIMGCETNWGLHSEHVNTLV